MGANNSIDLTHVNTTFHLVFAASAGITLVRVAQVARTLLTAPAIATETRSLKEKVTTSEPHFTAATPRSKPAKPCSASRRRLRRVATRPGSSPCQRSASASVQYRQLHPL